ncbi:MAG TPA: hypothetical protein VFB50_22135 [Chloroflexota bacterium]|nr:hypothetical protein [Chloroflexota bacterium]
MKALSTLLHQAAETHHLVFAITDGDDPDWATWYADWLVNLSRFSDLVGTKPPRSAVTYQLVSLDKEYAEAGSSEPWEDFYAARLMQRLSAAAE